MSDWWRERGDGTTCGGALTRRSRDETGLRKTRARTPATAVRSILDGHAGRWVPVRSLRRTGYRPGTTARRIAPEVEQQAHAQLRARLDASEGLMIISPPWSALALLVLRDGRFVRP